MNYNKNDLIDECLQRYYQTFACTLDTSDYVPKKYNVKILAYIFKNLKKQFKKLDREDRLYQVNLRRQQKHEQRNSRLNKENKDDQKEKECTLGKDIDNQ